MIVLIFFAVLLLAAVVAIIGTEVIPLLRRIADALESDTEQP